MLVKFSWLALICISIISGLSTDLQRRGIALSSDELKAAVGGCEGHGSLQVVTCQSSSVGCPVTNQIPTCNSATWNGGCTGVNSPKPDGSGSQKHQEAQCANTYDAGPCTFNLAGNACTQGAATSTGLTCGTMIGTDPC